MSSSTGDYSGIWLGGSGDISDLDNYLGGPWTRMIFFGGGGGAVGGVVPVGPIVGGFHPDIRSPAASQQASGKYVAQVPGGLNYTSDFPLLVAPFFELYPSGVIGPTSQLEYSGASILAPATFGWSLQIFSPGTVPPPPAPQSGDIVSSWLDISPDYTVSGDGHIGAMQTDSGSAAPGTITFTGAITTGILTVDDVTTVFDGGGVEMDADNAVDLGSGIVQSWATVDTDGTLVLTDGATGIFGGGIDENGDTDGLQVGDGLVVVSGQGSELDVQGLDLGEITVNAVNSVGDGEFDVLDGATATIVADDQYAILIGDLAGSTSAILVAGNGATLDFDDETGNGLMFGVDGDALLAIQDGGTVSINTDLTLGADAGGSGTISLDGPGASLQVTGSLIVGDDGDGVFDESDSASATITGNLIVAQGANSTGVVSVDDAGAVLTLPGTVTIGAAGAGAMIIFAGDTVTIGGDLTLAASAMSLGVVLADGTGSVLSVSGSAVIGLQGTGLISLSDGATGTITADATLAASGGSTGSLFADGDDTALTIGGTLAVGGDGDADVLVSNNASLQAADIEIATQPPAGGNTAIDPSTGFNTGNVQTVTVTDSVLTSDTLTVGVSGRGLLQVNDGTLTTTDDTVIASQAGSEGQVLINGGEWDAADITVGDGGKGLLSISQATVTAGDVTIGGDGGGQGMVVVASGGTLTDDMTLHNGTLVVNTGFVAIDGNMDIAPDAGDNAAAVINGGTLELDGGTLSVGAGGRGQLSFDQSGQLVGSPDVVLGEGGGGAGSLLASGDGTALNVGAITVGSGGSGNLTVTAGASLSGSGDADIADAVLARVQGATVSEGGIWKVGTDLTVGSDGLGTLSVKTGGAVDVADAVSIGDGAGAGGIVNVSGSAPTGSGGGTIDASLGYGTTLTVGNFGIGTLSVGAGGIVAQTLGGAGAIMVGAASGGAGVIAMSGGTLVGDTLALGGVGASGRLTIAAGLVTLAADATITATGSVGLTGGTLAARTVTIDPGGVLAGAGDVVGDVIDNGLIEAKSGLLSIRGALSGTGAAQIKAGATLAVAGLDKVQFVGAGAVLDLGSVPASGTAASVSGFTAGDTIDLTTDPGGNAGSVVGDSLVITGGGVTLATLRLSGDYSGALFDVGADASGDGTAITLAAGGSAVVTPPALTVAAPQTVDAAAGAAQPIGGLSVGDSTAGAIITATLFSNTGNLSASAAEGATVTSIDKGGGLVIVGGSLAVNAVLAGVTYTALAAGTDTLSVSVTDSDGDGDTGSIGISVPDRPPTLTLPGAQTVTADSAVTIAGISVASDVTADVAFTVTLSDSAGTLSATARGGSAVDGAGYMALTISGDLADVDADLATLTYLAAGMVTADTINIAVDDGTGGSATGTIAVAISAADDPPPSITLPDAPVLTSGTAGAISGLSIGDDAADGKTFTVTLALGMGTLDATAAGAAVLGGDGSGTLTIAGDLADIDTTLASLTAAIDPPAGFAVESLAITASDNLGATGTADLLISVTQPAAAAPTPPPAGSFNWAQPYLSGAFGDAANWLPADGPPGPTDEAGFGPGIYAVSGNGTVGQAQITGDVSFTGTLTALGLPNGALGVYVYSGGVASFGAGAALVSDASVLSLLDGTFNFAAGATGTFNTTADPGNASVDLATSATGTSQLTATGQGTTLTSDSDWLIGDVGDGAVRISDGAVVSVGTGHVDDTFATVIGSTLGAEGLLSVDGAGSRFDDAGGIYVGYAGTAELLVTNGATVTSDAQVGDLSAVVGYGEAGATGNPGAGDVLIGGGGALWDSEQDTTVGYYASGTVEVLADGTFESDGSLLRIGRIAGSNGTVVADGDGSALIAPNATILLGDAGSGQLTLEFGAIGSAAEVIIGAVAGGSGTLDLDAGTLTVAAAVTVEAGTITLSDEQSYDASSGDARTDSAVLSAGRLVIGAGGFVLDAGTIAAAITLDGGTLSASGTLTDAITVTGGTPAAPSTVLATTGALEIAQTITMAPDVTLLLDQDTTLDQGITGFAASDTLEFANADAGDSADNASLNDGTLTVYDENGFVFDAVALQGDYAGDAFTVTQDGTNAVVTVGPSITPPVPIDWDGATGGFDVAADWIGGVVPGTTDTAGFPDGGTLEGTGTVARIDVSSGMVFAGTFNALDGGTIDSGTDAYPAVLTVAEGDSLAAGGLLVIGDSGWGEFDLDISGTVDDAGTVDLGQRADGSGVLYILVATFNDSGPLIIGEEGAGSVEVQTLGTLVTGSAVLGDQLGSSGTMEVQAAGTWSVGDMIVGRYGQGTLTIDSYGTVNQSGAAVFGSHGYGNGYISGTWSIGSSLAVVNGVLDVEAGGSVAVAGVVVTGQDNGEADIEITGGGTLAVSDGGTVTQSTLGVSGAGSDLTVGTGGLDIEDSAVTVSDGATLAVTDTQIGVADDSGATTVDGVDSTLTTPLLSIGNATTATVLTISDGGLVSVQATTTVWDGSNLDFENGTLIAGTLDNDGLLTAGNVGSGGGTIEAAVTNTDQINVYSGTLDFAAGGLMNDDLIQIDGVLTLDVAMTGTGEVNVLDGGLLAMTTAQTLSAGAMIALYNGTLAVSSLLNDGVIQANTLFADSNTITGALTNAGLIAVDSGTLDVAAGSLVNDRLITVDAATLIVDVGLGGTGTVSVQGGSIDVRGPVSAGQQFILDPSSMTIGDVAAFLGTIYPSAGEQIIVDGADGGSYVANAFTFTQDGAVVGSVAAPGFNTDDLSFSTSNGTVTVLDTQPICYAAGTRIATPDGERPVETLQPGDIVIAADAQGRARAEPVRWVGRRCLDLSAHPDPELAAPIRIHAGAIAPGLPARDLLVSPDHCVLMDGHLLRAFRLLNGVSVTQEIARRSITYVHVELGRHALLLAEGLLAESYLDEGARGFFDGATQHPGPLHARVVPACAPFAADDAFAERIWRAVATRAGAAIPPPRPDRATLHLLAGERAMRPLFTAGQRCVFALPRGADRVRLVSPASRPTAARPWAEDRRRLGICVRRLALDNRQDVPLDSPSLGPGWWPWDAGPVRWTDGDADLRLPHGTRTIEVRCT
jgi:T5SS/PEP-CTERM-associated repeat protein